MIHMSMDRLSVGRRLGSALTSRLSRRWNAAIASLSWSLAPIRLAAWIAPIGRRSRPGLQPVRPLGRRSLMARAVGARAATAAESALSDYPWFACGVPALAGCRSASTEPGPTRHRRARLARHRRAGCERRIDRPSFTGPGSDARIDRPPRPWRERRERSRLRRAAPQAW